MMYFDCIKNLKLKHQNLKFSFHGVLHGVVTCVQDISIKFKVRLNAWSEK